PGNGLGTNGQNSSSPLPPPGLLGPGIGCPTPGGSGGMGGGLGSLPVQYHTQVHTMVLPIVVQIFRQLQLSCPWGSTELVGGSYWIPGSYVTSNSMSAGSNPLPRFLTLCTNSKKPR